MADQVHQYETAVSWTEGRQGTLSTPGRPQISIGAPPEFGGPENVWSPEQLCVGAVNACVMATFIAIAANSKVPFRQYSATARGTLEKVEGRGPVLTRIVVKPRIVVGPEIDHGRVERIIKMAEKNCYISNSLQTAVSLEAEIVTE